MKCSRKCELTKSIRNVINKNLGDWTTDNYTLSSFVICISVQKHQDDDVQKHYVVMACGN
jgi:hypothetical protein